MKLFNSLRSGNQPGVHTLEATSSSLASALSAAALRGLRATFVVGYVSPHVDLDGVARTLTARFPGVPLMLCSTAGELCSSGGGLYCRTGDSWDRVVVQCFDASLIERA